MWILLLGVKGYFLIGYLAFFWISLADPHPTLFYLRLKSRKKLLTTTDFADICVYLCYFSG